MFIVVALAVFEIPLVSYLTAPAQTQAVVLQLHNWLRSRRRRILAVMSLWRGSSWWPAAWAAPEQQHQEGKGYDVPVRDG